MQDGSLKDQLIRIAAKAPPVSYVFGLYDPEFHFLKEVLAAAPKGAAIANEAVKGFPGGVIVFGYPDMTSMKPITDILDQIPGLNYTSMNVKDGRTFYFLSHSAAQDYLPSPDEIRQERGRALLHDDLIDALHAAQRNKLLAEYRKSADKTGASLHR